jgi:DNA-binding MarR family transcriptional regulator
MKHSAVETAAESVDAQDQARGPSMLLLLEAAHAIEERLESALEAVGLSAAKYTALEALVQAHAPLTLGELAGRLRCVRSNVTQLVDRLEADGLVKRVDDPEDRRAVRAVVTDLGAERHAAGTEAMTRVQSELAARVDPAERDRFFQVLSALI